MIDSPIAIRLVRVTVQGRTYLMGATFSDRWNLRALGLGTFLPDTRNQGLLKALRRANPDFTFSLMRVSVSHQNGRFSSLVA